MVVLAMKNHRIILLALEDYEVFCGIWKESKNNYFAQIMLNASIVLTQVMELAPQNAIEGTFKAGVSNMRPRGHLRPAG